MASISSINPATNKKIKEYTLLSDTEVEKYLSLASDRFESWRLTSFSDKVKLFNNASKVLLKHKKKLAKSITDEMGKTFTSAISEIEKCSWVCEYYSKNGEKFLQDEIIETDASISMITYQPLGVILAVMPWNYPFWQVFRFAAPTLMAGNVAVLKHASNVPQCALDIEWVFKESGFPKNCFKSLLIGSDQVDKVLKNNKVKAATLTGSGPAGSSVASLAGNHIKKTVLELGGSDPYLILEDADIELAVEQCVTSRLLNSGQSCIGAKRFIVLEEIYNEFTSRFIDEMKASIYGDPYDNNSTFGPMARIDLRNEVHEQVQNSIKSGAILECGGFIPDEEGAFYPATVLTNVKPGMPAYEEEIFGPVASIIKVKNEKEAIKVANDSKFGLGACVFTKDISKGQKIATYDLQAGCCFVNQFVKSDPRLPFGGVKASGYGRELSMLGIREFTNIKTVYVK